MWGGFGDDLILRRMEMALVFAFFVSSGLDGHGTGGCRLRTAM